MATRRWRRDEEDKPRAPGIQPQQLRAAASPRLTLKQLAGDEKPSSAGNFQDLQSLLDQLGEPPIHELGNPLPDEKHLPRRGLSSCPAAHNRALLDELRD